MGIGNAIGAATGLIGGITGKNQQKAANAASSDYMNQMEQVATKLANNAQNMSNQYNQYYTPLLSNLAHSEQSNLGSTADLSQISHLLLQAGLDPSTISKITGVNEDQIAQNAINYLGNTGGTSLAGATPGALSVFQGMEQGLNPLFQQNAMNQVQQGANQQIAQARASAQPGTNINDLIQNIQNQALQQQSNLAGNFAGLSQQIAGQGAQGALGAAGNLDTQRQNMLQAAAQDASTLNQQQLANAQASGQYGQGILQAIQSLIGQGQQASESGYGALANVMNTQANASNNAANQAAQAGRSSAQGYGSFGTALGNLFTPTASTGYNLESALASPTAWPTSPQPTNYSLPLSSSNQPSTYNPPMYDPSMLNTNTPGIYQQSPILGESA